MPFTYSIPNIYTLLRREKSSSISSTSSSTRTSRTLSTSSGSSLDDSILNTSNAIYRFSSNASYSTSSLQNFQISDPILLIDTEKQRADPRLVRARTASVCEVAGSGKGGVEVDIEEFCMGCGIKDSVSSTSIASKGAENNTASLPPRPSLIRRPLSDVTNLKVPSKDADFKEVLEYRTVRVLEELECAKEMESWKKENWAKKFALPAEHAVANASGRVQVGTATVARRKKKSIADQAIKVWRDEVEK